MRINLRNVLTKIKQMVFSPALSFEDTSQFTSHHHHLATGLSKDILFLFAHKNLIILNSACWDYFRKFLRLILTLLIADMIPKTYPGVEIKS